MGLLKNIFSRSKEPINDRAIYLGKDKTGADVLWNVDDEHHAFFVGDLSEAHQFTSEIKNFVEKNPLKWESLSLYAPSYEMLKINDSRTVDAVRDFKAFLDPIERDIYSRIKQEQDATRPKPKSLILFIYHASMLTMTRSEWENTYPRMPYKATEFFQKKIRALMDNTTQGEIYIVLLDDMFSDYEYLIDNYGIDYGIETDEDGYLYKVDV